MVIKFPERKNFTLAKNFYYAVLLYFASPLLLIYKYLKVKKKPSPINQWRNGIIMGPTHIGDLLFFTSSLKILKKHLPECNWYCVTEKYSATILSNNPYIKGVIIIQSQKDLFNNQSNASKQIKQLAPDAAIIMMRNNYFMYLLSTINQGIPNIVSYSDKGMEYLITQEVSAPKDKLPHAAYYRQIVNEICNSTDTSSLQPEIFSNPDDYRRAEDFLFKTFAEPSKNIAVIFASVKTSNTNWPIPYYKQFVTLLGDNFDGNILLCGAKSDQALLTTIADGQNSNVKISAGELNLLELACVVKRSAFVFGPDSGPRHIGNAMNVPVFYIPDLFKSEIENGVYCEKEVNLLPGKSFLSESEVTTTLKEFTPQKAWDIISARITAKTKH